MRKYYQLLLIIVSVISVVSLLFYRNEYLKLRYVLQVFDFFGTVEVKNEDCVRLMSNLTDRINEENPFSEPRSAWTQFADFQVFSSFWIENGEESYSKTVAVGPRSAFVGIKCRLWFEIDDGIVVKDGEFSYNVDSDSIIHPYHRNTSHIRSSLLLKYDLLCRSKDKPLPWESASAVLLINNDQHRLLPVRYRQPKSAWQSVICIQPDYSVMSKINLIELLSYYDAIGISHVILYDNGIHHRIYPFLDYVNQRKRIFESITIVNWNFPLMPNDGVLSSVEYLAYKDDCLSRSYGIANVVVLSSWNQYVIPKKRHNLTDLLLPFAKSASELEVKLPTLVCCTDMKDDSTVDKAAPLISRKSYCKLHQQQPVMMVIIPESFKQQRPSQMLFDACTLRIYQDCHETPAGVVKLLKNKPLRLKQAKDFTAHELLRLWKVNLQTMKVADLNKININNIQ